MAGGGGGGGSRVMHTKTMYLVGSRSRSWLHTFFIIKKNNFLINNNTRNHCLKGCRSYSASFCLNTVNVKASLKRVR